MQEKGIQCHVYDARSIPDISIRVDMSIFLSLPNDFHRMLKAKNNHFNFSNFIDRYLYAKLAYLQIKKISRRSRDIGIKHRKITQDAPINEVQDPSSNKSTAWHNSLVILFLTRN